MFKEFTNKDAFKLRRIDYLILTLKTKVAIGEGLTKKDVYLIKDSLELLKSLQDLNRLDELKNIVNDNMKNLGYGQCKSKNPLTLVE